MLFLTFRIHVMVLLHRLCLVEQDNEIQLKAPLQFAQFLLRLKQTFYLFIYLYRLWDIVDHLSHSCDHSNGWGNITLLKVVLNKMLCDVSEVWWVHCCNGKRYFYLNFGFSVFFQCYDKIYWQWISKRKCKAKKIAKKVITYMPNINRNPHIKWRLLFVVAGIK